MAVKVLALDTEQFRTVKILGQQRWNFYTVYYSGNYSQKIGIL